MVNSRSCRQIHQQTIFKCIIQCDWWVQNGQVIYESCWMVYVCCTPQEHAVSWINLYVVVCVFDTHATLMKAALPPKRKERLITSRTNVKYWSGREGMQAQTENNTHCSAVRKRESTEALRSASCSLSPTHTIQHTPVPLKRNSADISIHTDQSTQQQLIPLMTVGTLNMIIFYSLYGKSPLTVLSCALRWVSL